MSNDLTFALSVVAIALSISAIAFELAFFLVQRAEAKALTKNVQDLVFQAVRSEKGIDQLSGQTMPIIEQLVQARITADRAQAAPAVEESVRELLDPLEARFAHLEERIMKAPQGDAISALRHELDALRAQVAEIPRQAGERTASRAASAGSYWCRFDDAVARGILALSRAARQSHFLAYEQAEKALSEVRATADDIAEDWGVRESYLFFPGEKGFVVGAYSELLQQAGDELTREGRAIEDVRNLILSIGQATSQITLILADGCSLTVARPRPDGKR
jgi:hypothetical protein